MARKSATAVRKTVKKKTAAKPAAKKPASTKKVNISDAELSSMIERRAFEIFMERGCSHGDNHGDWYRAEQELKKKLKPKN